MDDSTPVGFTRRDAVRIENTVLDYEHCVIGSRTPRKRRQLPEGDGSGTGLPLIRYEITSPDCADGSALAVITAVSCDVTSPAVGDEITLLDEDGWFSGETNATLNGRTGTAHKFNIPSGYDDCSYVIITISPAPYEC